MTMILLVPGDDGDGPLARLVRLAGYRPALPAPGETATDAVERLRPDVVLVDAARTIPAQLVPASLRSGALVVYASDTMSAYDLAAFARRRGVLHLPPGGAGLLRRLVQDTLAARRAHAAADEPAWHANPVLADAAKGIERARQLARQSAQVMATSQVLRTERRIVIAAARARRESVRDALHGAIAEATRELHAQGTPLDAVLALVWTALERSAAAAFGGRTPVEWEEAARWCVDAYRAA